MPPTPLWRGPAPLLLASTSLARRRLLDGAGIPVETEASGVDERALEATFGADLSGAGELASRLALAKAVAVSSRRPERLVLGADQTLECDGDRLHAPADPEAAREQLARLSGRTHVLHSAVTIARGGERLRGVVESARLTMRPLTFAMIAHYVALAGEGATRSVGAYQIEGIGIHLFEEIKGDHATILGLPLLRVIASLRELDLLSL